MEPTQPKTAKELVDGFKVAMDKEDSVVPSGADKNVVIIGMLANWRDAIPGDRKTAADEDFDARLTDTIEAVKAGDTKVAADFVDQNSTVIASMIHDLATAG